MGWNNSKRLALASALVLWLILSTVAASSLTAWHWVALPNPRKVVAPHRDGWRLTHYLSPECACSRAVASYLVKRGPLAIAAEEIVVVRSADSEKDAALAKKLTDRQFPVRFLMAADGVEGVPALEITAPGNRLAFRGGYRNRGASPGTYLDAAILADLMASKPVHDLPIYGCATSERLRRLLDPARLKSLNF